VTGLSSTEDEVVGVSDTVTYAPWMRALLNGLNQSQRKSTIIYQVNQPAMPMHVSGGSFSRSKHIFIRGCYIKEGIDNGITSLVYCPTDEWSKTSARSHFPAQISKDYT
jgi:hypothetical protein